MAGATSIVIDDKQVRKTFALYPVESARRLSTLIEGAAIDTQREMRMNVNVGATGETRQSIRYTTNKSQFSASIGPNLPEARVMSLEKGSRPHWVSARPGTPLHRWARSKGISPYAVQRSIARKGTKAHPFIEPTYQTMKPRVENDVVSGFAKFIGEVNNGLI